MSYDEAQQLIKLFMVYHFNQLKEGEVQTSTEKINGKINFVNNFEYLEVEKDNILKKIEFQDTIYCSIKLNNQRNKSIDEIEIGNIFEIKRF